MNISSIGNAMSTPFSGAGRKISDDATSTNLTHQGETLLQSKLNELPEGEKEPLREAFRDFVGQTFFGQMIASMRSTQQEPAYFHGGQAEKIFQGQFDQTMAESISEKSASKVADPMFELFQLKRK